MKKTLLLLIFLPLFVLAQDVVPSLKEFEDTKYEINRTGMLVLGGWALANIVSGTTLSFTTKGEAKYFNQFNALWNTINLGLALNGLFNTGTDSLSLLNSVTGHQTLQNIFVLNAGLDLAYIATGLFLKEKAKNSDKKDILTGYGNSLLVQGAFLLVFDAAMYFIHQNNANVTLYPLLGTLTDPGVGLGMRVGF
ncbi:MAG: hypothetical protein IPN18_04395 [Ignavibacteriales bacterium]|jgi:hypothetical protein|nr:hypothetical protein [Ignavibacteriales bacterium]